MNMLRITVIFIVTVLVLAITSPGCVHLRNVFLPPELKITPDRAVLSPALLKEPITFTGSGWRPNEIVVINLLVPEGVIIKGINKGDPIGIATGNADENGNLTTKIGPISILMTFIQVDWDDNKMKPDLSKAKPLAPGTYIIEAIGFDSERVAKSTLTLVSPPEKK